MKPQAFCRHFFSTRMNRGLKAYVYHLLQVNSITFFYFYYSFSKYLGCRRGQNIPLREQLGRIPEFEPTFVTKIMMRGKMLKRSLIIHRSLLAQDDLEERSGRRAPGKVLDTHGDEATLFDAQPTQRDQSISPVPLESKVRSRTPSCEACLMPLT